MKYRLVRHGTPGELLDVAADFFAADEALRGMVWGLARLNDANPDEHHGVANTWTLQREATNQVVGAFFWGPAKRSLTMTDMPDDAGPALLLGLADVLAKNSSPRLPGCFGPEAATAVFARALEAEGRSCLRVTHNMLLYRCSKITRTLDLPGQSRLATQDDSELVNRWATEFGIETEMTKEGDPPMRMTPHLLAGRVFLWEVDGVAVASASWSRPTPRSASIGFVYTPKGERGKHYASAITTEITKHVIDDMGKSFATLFTIAENRTSNHLYPALGYGLVASFREMKLS
ncbi:MAG: putative GNAT family acetyltransferase [Planctomycetota bacterium]|jgi:predicted GNAT family acetyltransferase